MERENASERDDPLPSGGVPGFHRCYPVRSPQISVKASVFVCRLHVRNLRFLQGD